MRIDPRAALATCAHCRVQSRVQRVTSDAELEAASSEPVIRVVVRGGARLVLTTLAITAVLVLMVFAGLAANHFATSGDSATPDARVSVDLSRASSPLEDHAAVLVLSDDSLVIGSSSGRLMLLDPKGRAQRNLDLPLPAPRSRLAGLARDDAQGFFASLGGAIVHVSGGAVGPALPTEPSRRVYGAIANDPRGQLHAITSAGELARVGRDGLPAHAEPLGLPANARPLDVRGFAFAPDGRVVIAEPLFGQMWWFDPGARTLTPLAKQWDRVGSTLACLPDGSVVFDPGGKLMRVRPDGRATPLPLARPSWLEFHAVAADARGGLVALSISGTLARYDAAQLGP